MTDTYIAPYIPFAMVNPQTGTPTPSFQAFWKSALEGTEAAAVAAAAANANANSRQPGSTSLTALAALAGTGLVEQTGANSFTDRAIGVGASTSIPTRADADGRYVLQLQTPTWLPSTGTAARTAYPAYTGQTVSSPPTQAQVQQIDDALVAISQHVVALILDLIANKALKS